MSNSPNKELVRKFTDLVWNQRDMESAKDLLHEEMSYQGPRMTVEGKKEYVELISQYMNIVTDSKMVVHKLVEENDQVACYGQLTGRHTGAYNDIQPTQNQVTVQLMAFIEFKDGKIYSETEVFDELGFLQDMGMEVVQKAHA